MLSVSAALRSGNETQNLPTPADETLREVNKRLRAEISELRLKMIEMEMMADMDPLVPVLNRRAFIREINRAISVQQRYNITSSIIYFDLDNFKTINDVFGHHMGDAVLREVADIAQKSVRDCDVVARLGGDEFSILLFQSDAAMAKKKAAQICSAIETASELLVSKYSDTLEKIAEVNYDLTVSTAWGVSQCLGDIDAEDNLSLADKAMYQDKMLRRKEAARRASLQRVTR